MKPAWRTALYARISKEDERDGDSSSITTQLKMLNAYAEENDFFVCGEYIDDGLSGVNFDNRPEFNRMIKDIEAGQINLVITKDFSRLGRDFVMSGYYTERFFPENKVRYIALNDCYDSESQTNNDLTPFKHVINEMYARDISRKVQSSFKTKMKEGQFIGNFAPYGYQKSPADKNKLIIDPVSAAVVKEMFDLAKSNRRPSDIADLFNARGIITPAMYRCESRDYLDVDNYSKRKEWTSAIVCKMLRNIVYLGHTAQGKTTKIFKSKKTLSNSMSDWYIVENTHEAIVSSETFQQVRSRCVSRRSAPVNGFRNAFTGIAKCMDCGRNMSTTGTRRKGSAANLVCGGYKLYGAKECNNHFIDYEFLYESVASELQELLNLTEQEKAELYEKPNQENADRQLTLYDFAKEEAAYEIPEFNVLEPALLQKLIERIEIGQGVFETDKKGKKIKRQEIKIHYRFIGEMQS